MQVLVVEDDIEIQGFLKHSLIEAGYQVETAGDARTAQGLAAAGRSDSGPWVARPGWPQPDLAPAAAWRESASADFVCETFGRRPSARVGAGRGRLFDQAVRARGTPGETSQPAEAGYPRK